MAGGAILAKLGDEAHTDEDEKELEKDELDNHDYTKQAKYKHKKHHTEYKHKKHHDKHRRQAHRKEEFPEGWRMADVRRTEGESRPDAGRMPDRCRTGGGPMAFGRRPDGESRTVA